MCKVSVIVPVYGVEKFITHCVDSLMAQTMREGVEYIFVDDASQDASIERLTSVLSKYPERATQVKILVHERNKGLPAARNTGLAQATGEYVFHCDSDDFVEPEMLEVLYGEAKEKDADIVWCDWFLTFGSTERYMKQPEYDNPEDALKAMLGGAMKFNVWNKLVRRNLYTDNAITFPAGHGMGEDMTMMMFFSYAKKIAYVPMAFYHYVKTNTAAFSQTYSARHLEELKYNVNRISSFIRSRYGNSMEKEIAFLKLEAKFPFIMSDGKDGKYKLWSSWYPEANRYIMQNTNTSIRRRLVQWCAGKKLFVLVWLYNVLLNKIVYGVLYH